MSLVTPKEIDDAFIAVFDDVAHYRSEMKRLDETMSDGWLNLVDADREGRSHATLNASAYAHRDDGVRARIRVQASDDTFGESADDFALTPANAAASLSGADGAPAPPPKSAFAASLVNLEELAPSSPLWTDIKAAASAAPAPKAVGARTGMNSDCNNTCANAADASNDAPEGSDNEDESEYDFADDPELDALIGSGAGGGKDASKLRDRRAPRTKPAAAAATAAASSSCSPAADDAVSAPAAPLFTSAEALQAWFAPLPLPSLNDAQRSFVAAVTAALTVAGRKRRLEAILAQLERITAEPFALDDTAAAKGVQAGKTAPAPASPEPVAQAAGLE